MVAASPLAILPYPARRGVSSPNGGRAAPTRGPVCPSAPGSWRRGWLRPRGAQAGKIPLRDLCSPCDLGHTAATFGSLRGLSV